MILDFLLFILCENASIRVVTMRENRGLLALFIGVISLSTSVTSVEITRRHYFRSVPRVWIYYFIYVSDTKIADIDFRGSQLEIYIS